MPQKRYTEDQIIPMLRRADVELGKGMKVPEICKLLGISTQTYYRWRQKYGGMAPEMVPFNLSLGIDQRLWREDVRGSVAWARAIGAAAVPPCAPACSATTATAISGTSTGANATNQA